MKYLNVLFVLTCLFTVCTFAQNPPRRKDATTKTIEANTKAYKDRNWDDTRDFTNATRGFMRGLDPFVITTDYPATTGKVIWDLNKYKYQMKDFPNEWVQDGYDILPDGYPPCPPTINPSLWRNSVLNSIHGVFEVVPGEIFQVRGYDLSVMTLVKGTKGWIVIDPLISPQTARAALDNANAAYLEKYAYPDGFDGTVSNVIFTHSHVDHYGGVMGLFPNGEIGDTPVYSPEGFAEHAISENVIAGNAMTRRATYMYGSILRKDAKGQVDGGLGKTTSTGESGLALDNRYIIYGGERITIDDEPVVFQNVPGSEAPAEIMFYFEDHKAFCASEDVTHTFHNVLTLRGANVRDPLAWANYLTETMELFPDIQVIFASHHWPTWRLNVNKLPIVPNPVTEILESQRNLYKYIHDQAVRLLNHGFTIQEVGERLVMPESLADRWYNRDYYGTVNHNAKAVYQRYIGWFDGNPASLHQLPPQQASEKYVAYMGGIQNIYDKAIIDYANGDYRWVGMVLNHVVYGYSGRVLSLASPEREAYVNARKLLADTYEQLGYQAESGPWRNFYLTGAQELRNGVLPLPSPATVTPSVVENMTLSMIYDYLSVRLNGPCAGEMDYTFLVELTDVSGPGKYSSLRIKDGVLVYKVYPDSNNLPGNVTATLTLTRVLLNNMVIGDGFDSSQIGVIPEDARDDADQFFGCIETFKFWFQILQANGEQPVTLPAIEKPTRPASPKGKKSK